MIEMTASEIAGAVGGQLHGPDTTVTGPVVVDSRLAEPGGVFVAIDGEHVDGADFAAKAVEAGAGAVLAARPIAGLSAPVIVVDDVQTALGKLAGHSLRRVREVNPDLRVVAITGSQGKTTTKDLLAQLLTDDLAGSDVIAPVGSFNNEIGLPLTVLRISPATKFAALEMGADHPGNIADLTAIAPPQVGTVLTVGTAHLETFGSRDGIAEAKSEMIGGTLPGGAAVLNLDDHRVANMKHKADARNLRAVMFGTNPDADVAAENITLDELGRASFTLKVKPEVFNSVDDADLAAADGEALRMPVKLQVMGEHHVSNALAAATSALLVGIPAQTVAKRLSNAKPLSPHRMAVTDRPDGIIVIDDAYNANPESMRAGMQTLAKVANGRRSVAIIGAMRELGEGGVEAHDEIGRLAVRLGLNKFVVIGPGARASHEAAVQEGSWDGESVYFEDLDAARAALPGILKSGDVVLVKASNGSGLWRLADELAAGEYSPLETS